MDVMLRQVWLRKSSRKLQLIYAGETLTDCIDEKLVRWNDSECLPGSRRVYHYHDDGDEVSIEVFQLDGEDASRIPRDLSWLLSSSELHYQCERVRMRVRGQVAAQTRHRYDSASEYYIHPSRYTTFYPQRENPSSKLMLFDV